ncbi:MAG: sulfate reduction electron transfer complex DsrMKJOP subunit DsrJ [Deltaproteobacteria bacterium]|nr:sulfate reduction electron transfer complex DsrMKJOP subunit DsrJ [Deltaproteobacteria bacterium]
MKLYNRGMIIAGILVFLILATFPFWYGGGKAVPPPDLKLDTPAIQRLKEKRCVESTPYMRANHMKLLAAWRDAAVREGNRSYTAADGQVIPVSLTGTCLGCHSNKDKFCDRCHDYSGAKPACWNCHIIPEEVR